MKVRAWNAFSSLEVAVDVFALCGEDSGTKLNYVNEHVLSLNKKTVIYLTVILPVRVQRRSSPTSSFNFSCISP